MTSEVVSLRQSVIVEYGTEKCKEKVALDSIFFLNGPINSTILGWNWLLLTCGSDIAEVGNTTLFQVPILHTIKSHLMDHTFFLR